MNADQEGMLTDTLLAEPQGHRAASSPSGPGPHLDDAEDLELVARVGAHDRDAMRELFVRYQRRLKRFLGRLTPRPDLADEIVNDTMMVVWRRAGAFRGESRVSTWIMGIAWRQGMKCVQRERRASAYPAMDVDSVPSPSIAVERNDWLSKALEELSHEQRAVLELAYVAGQSCEEIAAVMSCPVNTVKTRLFYARRRLRTQLDPAPQDSSSAQPAIEPTRPPRARTG